MTNSLIHWNSARSWNGPDPGIIERIELRSIMCHTKLVVELGPRVNFIIGKNGSGTVCINCIVW